MHACIYIYIYIYQRDEHQSSGSPVEKSAVPLIPHVRVLLSLQRPTFQRIAKHQ